MSNTGKVFIVAVSLAAIISLSSFAYAAKKADGSNGNGNNSLNPKHKQVQDYIDMMISCYCDNWDVWRYRQMADALMLARSTWATSGIPYLQGKSVEEKTAILFAAKVYERAKADTHIDTGEGLQAYSYAKWNKGTKPPPAGFIGDVLTWIADHAVDIYVYLRDKVSNTSGGNEPTPDAMTQPTSFTV